MATDALSRHVTVIDSVTYEAVAWPATQSMRMSGKACEIFGDAGVGLLLRALGVSELGSQLSDKKGAALGVALAMAAAQTGHADDFDVFVRSCFKAVSSPQVRIGDVETRESVYEHFDSHFMGRLPHMYLVFTWVYSVSFTRPDGASR